MSSDVLKKANEEAPRQYFEKASARGDPAALVSLGFLQESGSTKPAAKRRAFDLYWRAAEHGYYLGAAAVGFAYERGMGVPINMSKATRWYLRAAELGDDWSMVRLAIIAKTDSTGIDMSSWPARLRTVVESYETRDVTLQDLLRSCATYNPSLEPTLGRVRRNAELSPRQQAEIVSLFEDLRRGSRSLHDLVTAFQATRHNPAALVHLFEFYLLSDLHPQAFALLDEIRDTWPQLLSQFRTDTPMNRLFTAVVSDYSCSIFRYVKSEEQLRAYYDNGFSFFWQLMLCARLKEPGTDMQEEIERWIAVGVRFNDDVALNHSAHLRLNAEYESRIERLENESIASRQMRQAALRGNVQAQRNLAILSVPPKTVEDTGLDELRWYYISALQNHASAIAGLASIYATGPIGLRDQQRAIRLFRSAAEGGHPEAQEALGRHLAKSPHTKHEAIYWAFRAALSKSTAPKDWGYTVLRNALAKAKRINPDATIDMVLGPAYEQMARNFNAELHQTRGLDQMLAKAEALATFATVFDDKRDAVRYHILAAEFKATYFDLQFEQGLPYFRLLGRSCVYGDASRKLYDLKAFQPALYYAIRSVNLLQSARLYLGDLPHDVRECFLRVHEDRYRWLADLFVAMGRLAEAESVLSMLDDFKTTEYVRGLRAGVRSTAQLPEVSGGEAVTQKLANSRQGILLASARRRELIGQRESAEWQALNQQYEEAYVRFKQEVTQISASMSEWKSSTEVVAFHAREDPRLALSNALRDQLAAAEAAGAPAAAILTFVLPERTTVIVVTASGRSFSRWEIRADELTTLVAKYRQALLNDSKEATELGQILYTNLLGESMAELRQLGIKTLLVSLDRSLSYLPIGALHTGNQYLIEEMAVALLTPAPAVRSEGGRPDHWRAAAFGVSMQVGNLDPLPGVETELKSVVRRMGESDGALSGERWLDKEFTRDNLRTALRSRTNVVHFATHFVLGETEKDSYLLAGNGDRIFLPDLESGFNFEDVELLVLSACNTGVPLLIESESRVESAARRLHDMSGSKAVVGTLWRVADASTADFMRTFYSNLTRVPRLTFAEALAETQRTFISGPKATEPRYWAPFVVTATSR
ncbi:CHAT domain-containing protein [Achromobacter sp. NFACC18-2]|nr:CHAT domain-containing protein [Achromobacter sp. NFACC18-2]